MRVPVGVLMAALIGPLVAGCGIASAKGDAELVAQSYFDRTRNHDYDAAMGLFSDSFFKQTARDDWRLMLEKIDQKLGPVQSYKLIGWHVFQGTRVGGISGTTVDLSYEAKHEKYPAQVLIVVNKPPGGREYRIVSMNINSPGLLLE